MDQQNDPYAFLSDLNNQDNFNTFLSQFQGPTVNIKKADENVQEDVGLVGNVLSSMVRGAVRNYTDLPKLVGQVPGLGALEDFGVGVDEAVNKIAPLDVKYKDSFWATAIPTGLGQVLGMLGGGIVGGAAKAAGGGVKGLVGSLTAAGKLAQNAATLGKSADVAADAAKAAQLFTEAAQLGTKAKTLKDFSTKASTYLMGGSEGYDAFVRSIEEEGDDVLTATAKSLGYATLAGAIEAKQLGRIYDRVAGMFGKELATDIAKESGNEIIKRGFKEYLNRDVWKEMVSGFAEEAQQALAQDLIVGKGFSTDLGRVVTEGGAGAVIQGLVGAVTGIPRLRGITLPPGTPPVGEESNTPLTKAASENAGVSTDADKIAKDIAERRAEKPDKEVEVEGKPPEVPAAAPEPTAAPVVVPAAAPEPTAAPVVVPAAAPEPTAAPVVVPAAAPEPTAAEVPAAPKPAAAPEPTAAPEVPAAPKPAAAPEPTAATEVPAAPKPAAAPEPTAATEVPAAPKPAAAPEPTAAEVPPATEVPAAPKPAAAPEPTAAPEVPTAETGVPPKKPRRSKKTVATPQSLPTTTEAAPTVSTEVTPTVSTEVTAPSPVAEVAALDPKTEGALVKLAGFIPGLNLDTNSAEGITAAQDKSLSKGSKDELDAWKNVAKSEGITVPPKATFKSVLQLLLDKRKAASAPAPTPTGVAAPSPLPASTTSSTSVVTPSTPTPTPTPVPKAAAKQRKAQQKQAEETAQRKAEEKVAERAAKKAASEAEKARLAQARVTVKEAKAAAAAAEKEAKATAKALAKADREALKAAAGNRASAKVVIGQVKALKASSEITVGEPAPEGALPLTPEEQALVTRFTIGNAQNSQNGVVAFSARPVEERAQILEAYTQQVLATGIIPPTGTLTLKLNASPKQAAELRDKMRAAYELKYPKSEKPEGSKIRYRQIGYAINVPFTVEETTDADGKRAVIQKPYFDNTVETAARAINAGLTLQVPAGIEVHPRIVVDKKGVVVAVDYNGYAVTKPGDYSAIRENDKAAISLSVARAESRLAETQENWFNDVIANEFLPRYTALSSETKQAILKQVKAKDTSNLKDRIAQVAAIIRDRENSLVSPEGEGFAEEIKDEIAGYKTLRDNLASFNEASMYSSDAWLLAVDPKIVRDVVTGDLNFAPADKAKMDELVRVVDARFNLIEESLFPSVASNINSNALLALTQKIRKEGAKGTLGILVSMGDVLNQNHWMVRQTVLRKFSNLTKLTREEGREFAEFQIPISKPDGGFELVKRIVPTEDAMQAWTDYLSTIDKANPETNSLNKYVGGNPKDRVAAQFLQAAQVTKNDVITEQVAAAVQSWSSTFPNINQEAWARIVVERLQNSLRSYKGQDPKSRTDPILYGVRKAVYRAAQNLNQKTITSIQEKSLDSEELSLVVQAQDAAMALSRKSTGLRSDVSEAFLSTVEEKTKAVKLTIAIGAKNKKTVVQFPTGETLFDILAAQRPEELQTRTFTQGEFNQLKQVAVKVKSELAAQLLDTPNAMQVLRRSNEPQLVKELEGIYFETAESKRARRLAETQGKAAYEGAVNIPTDAQGRMLPLESLSFKQLMLLSPKFSKAKVTNILMRQVDVAMLEAKAKELGAYSLLRYGTPYAGVQGFYDPLNDTVTLSLDNLDGTETAIRKLYHELTERNLVYLQATPKGAAELKSILQSAKSSLMAEAKSLIAGSGYASLEELNAAYGFSTEEELLGELMARYSERLADKPKPNWWQTLLAKVQLWLSNTFGTSISPRALEHWLAGNIQRFAEASPDVPTLAKTVAEKIKRIDENYMAADEKTQGLIVDNAAQAAGLVGPLYHNGSFDAAAGDVLAKPMHLGTEQAAIERGVGKVVDDEVTAVEAYQDDAGNWYWDDTQGVTSEELGEEGYATEREALEAGRAYVFSVLNTDALDSSEQKVNRLFIDAKKIKRVSDVGGANGEWDAEIAQAQQEGYDAISYVNQYEDRGSVSYIVWAPNQVKSGEAVVRDDAGNLIPPSNRFNLSSSDPRFSRINTETDEPLTPEELKLFAAELAGEGAVVPRERFARDTRKMIHPAGTLREPRPLWMATRSVQISTDNPDHHELYRKLNSLNMQQLEKAGLTNVTVQLDEIDSPYSFDPTTNILTFSSKENVPYSEMADAIMRAGMQAGMVNLALNGLPSKYGRVKADEALAKLRRAMTVAKVTESPEEFASRVFTDTEYMDRLYRTHPPGNPSENAGRMVMDSLYTLLGVNPDGGLAEGVARIFGSSQEAARFAESRRTRAERFGGTKVTTAARALFGDAVNTALEDSTYIAETEKENFANASAWVKQFADVEDAFIALRSDSTEAKRLTSREKSVAYTLIANELTALSNLAKARNEPYLAKDLMDLAVIVGREVQNIASAAGSDLQVFGMLKRMFDSNYVANTVVQPISATQGEAVGGDQTVVDIESARPTISVEAAAATGADPKVDRLIKVVAGGKVDPDIDQLVFDFFHEVYDSTKLNDKMIAQLTERLVKKTMSRLTGGVPNPVVASLKSKLYSQVNAQLNGILKTEAAKPAPNVASILIDNLDLAERLFDGVKNDLLASGTLTVEQAESMAKAKFQPFDYAKAKQILKSQVSLAKAVRTTLSDQKATLGSVIRTLLDNSDLSETEAAKVAGILEQVYNQEASKEARKQLEAMAKTKPKTDRVQLSQFDKLVKLFNLGAYKEEDLWNAIAEQNPSLKLPTYDKDLVDSLAKEADEIQKLPEGVVKDERRAGVMSKVAAIHSKNLSGSDKVWYYVGDVGPAIWKAGILSGIPTQTVNFVATQLNVAVQSISKAIGYWVKTGDPKFFKDVIDSYFAFNTLLDPTNSMRVVSDQAIKTGQNRFALQSGKSFSILESITKGPFKWHKYVGRLMSSADAFNTQLAYEINQRFAMRYAEINNPALAKSGQGFNPNATVKAAIESQLDSEGLKGRFRNLRRIELTERYRQDLVNDNQFLTKSLSTSLEWTMNSQPKGILGLLFQGTANALLKPTRGLSTYLLPFMGTVVNLTNAALDFGPVGIARAFGYRASKYFDADNKYKAESPEIGSPEFYTQLAQGITGTAAFLVLGLLGAKALDDEEEGKTPYFAIYGPGPNDPNQSGQWRAAGWLPYTLRIGDTAIPYRDMPGISLLLGSLGTVFDTLRFIKKPDEKSVGELSIMAGLGIASSLFDKNLLAGVSSLFEVLKNPNERGIAGLKRMAGSYVSGFTNPRLLNQVGEQILRTDEKGNIVVQDTKTFKAWTMSMLPFGGFGNRPALNVLGEPVTKHRWDPLTQRFVDLFTEPHPILAPVVKAGLTIPSPSKSTKFVYEGKEYYMSASDPVFRRFVELRGAALTRALTPSMLRYLDTTSDTLGKDTAQTKLRTITERCRDQAIRTVQYELASKKLSME